MESWLNMHTSHTRVYDVNLNWSFTHLYKSVVGGHTPRLGQFIRPESEYSIVGYAGVEHLPTLGVSFAEFATPPIYRHNAGEQYTVELANCCVN